MEHANSLSQHPRLRKVCSSITLDPNAALGGGGGGGGRTNVTPVTPGQSSMACNFAPTIPAGGDGGVGAEPGTSGKGGASLPSSINASPRWLCILGVHVWGVQAAHTSRGKSRQATSWYFLHNKSSLRRLMSKWQNNQCM